jgi:hypothetical protein
MKKETKALLITLLIMILSVCSVYYFGAIGVLYAIIGIIAFAVIYSAILDIIDN